MEYRIEKTYTYEDNAFVFQSFFLNGKLIHRAYEEESAQTFIEGFITSLEACGLIYILIERNEQTNFFESIVRSRTYMVKGKSPEMLPCPFCGCEMRVALETAGYRWKGGHASCCILELNDSAHWEFQEPKCATVDNNKQRCEGKPLKRVIYRGKELYLCGSCERRAEEDYIDYLVT